MKCPISQMNPPNSEPGREVLTANHAKDANGFNAKDFDTLRQLPILETRAENILAVTFTNKAACGMQERVNKLIPRQKSAHLKKNPIPRRYACPMDILQLPMLVFMRFICLLTMVAFFI